MTWDRARARRRVRAKRFISLIIESYRRVVDSVYF